jgi:membrane-associated phospholipid phosphatase
LNFRGLPGRGVSIWRNYFYWIIAAVIGIPLFALDSRIKAFSQNPEIHTKALDFFFVPVHLFGIGVEYAVAIILLVILGFLHKKIKPFLVGGELLAGLLAGGVITRIFKFFVGRIRPCNSASPFDFFQGGFSFYSGDVCTAFVFATIITIEYPTQNLSFIGIRRNLPLLPILLYLATALVALQRIYSNQHWASDVYYGGLISFVIASMTVRYRRILFRHLKIRQIDS